MITRISRVVILFLLFAVTVITVGPYLWLVSTSLKCAEELFQFPPAFIPKDFVFENYPGVWNAIPFEKYFINSLIVTIVTVILTVFFSSLAGFALARFQFRGRNFLFFLILSTIMIPQEVIIIPLYTIILKMRLADTLIGVILPFAISGFAVFMMRQAYLSIPKEIEEAGIMDGCSYLKLWWKVMMPMTKPTIATLTIFTFISTWGDFLWPLIVLKSPENYTLQVGLSYMIGTFINNYRFVAAGAVLATIPMIIVFLLMQKYFERGIFAGSVKQ